MNATSIVKLQEYLAQGISKSKIAELLSTSRRSVGRAIDKLRDNQENIEVIAKYERQSQLNRDKLNFKTKIIRENARQTNMLETMNNSLIQVLSKNAFHCNSPGQIASNSSHVGVIQLSDVHFNEIIKDALGNSYDFTIASKRIKKFITKSIKYFKAFGVENIALFFTGDLLNSDRRLDEVTNLATNRSKAIFLAVDILQQAINELLLNFKNVTVSSITGNESRVGENVHWTELLASDSYDIVIHNMLTILFKDNQNIAFLPVLNSLESIVNVNGMNFCLVHGHGHGGLARVGNIESQVNKLKAKYSMQNIRIDYVICGHIHSAFISDTFARSSGLCGANSYSDKALNLNGKASQNIYIVSSTGDIDGLKIDLQNTQDITEYYAFDRALETYQKSPQVNTIIQQVLV